MGERELGVATTDVPDIVLEVVQQVGAAAHGQLDRPRLRRIPLGVRELVDQLGVAAATSVIDTERCRLGTSGTTVSGSPRSQLQPDVHADGQRIPRPTRSRPGPGSSRRMTPEMLQRRVRLAEASAVRTARVRRSRTRRTALPARHPCREPVAHGGSLDAIRQQVRWLFPRGAVQTNRAATVRRRARDRERAVLTSAA